jgi:hypothetical protein
MPSLVGNSQIDARCITKAIFKSNSMVPVISFKKRR